MILDGQVTRLPNGLRVATAAMTHVESVSIGVWVGAGGRYEPAAWSGISHFVEHLLFKGTRRRSARQLSEAIEGRGGELNAFTQEEDTCYFARVAAERTWEGLDVLLDMYLEPRLAPEDIGRERAVVVEEIMMGRDQPQQVVDEALGELLWPAHPLGRPITGTPETIGRLGRREIRQYLRDTYVPANTVLAFAGQVDHAACVERVGRYLAELPGGAPVRFAPVRPGLKPHRLCLVRKEIEQAHVALGIRTFGRHDPRRFALKLLSVVLGENMSSRLFQVVREEHGLAYAIQSGAHLFHDAGTLSVTAGLDSERIDRALHLIVRELRRLRDEPVGPRELARARDYAVGQIRLGLEGTGSQMMWVGEQIRAYGRIVSPEATIEALQAVTVSDVQDLARHILRPAGMSLAVVAPELPGGAEDRLAGALSRVGG